MGETEFFLFAVFTTGLVLFTFGWMFLNFIRLFKVDEVNDDDDYATRMGQMMSCIRPPMAVFFTLGIPAFIYFVVRSGVWF